MPNKTNRVGRTSAVKGLKTASSSSASASKTAKARKSTRQSASKSAKPALRVSGKTVSRTRAQSSPSGVLKKAIRVEAPAAAPVSIQAPAQAELKAQMAKLPEESAVDLRKSIEWLTMEGYCIRRGPHNYRPTPRAEGVYREFRKKNELSHYFEKQGAEDPQRIAEAFHSIVQVTS